MPAGEGTSQDWRLGESWDEFIFRVLFDLIFEVFFNLWISDRTKLSDSWRPDEEGQDVLTADPTLSFVFCDDGPLACSRDHLFVPQVSCDDALLLLNEARLDRLVHSL